MVYILIQRWQRAFDGLIDADAVEMGKEVTLLWGEPNSNRRTVEDHEVVGIRATIAPVPYFDKSIKRD